MSNARRSLPSHSTRKPGSAPAVASWSTPLGALAGRELRVARDPMAQSMIQLILRSNAGAALEGTVH